jgi:DNA replication protein DnaC
MEKPFEIKNGMRHFNFHKTLLYLQHHGQQKFGSSFKIFKEDIPTIHKLIIYMINEEDQCKKYNIDLKKGILLSGPVGCGKTTWMKIIQCLAFDEQKFMVKPTREIAFNFNKEGYNSIITIGKSKKIICLDDLGVEQNIKFFGNECNTIGEVILSRYEMNTYHNILTHATTNLKASELEEVYGIRVRSRLRSMFNLISFPSTSKDKRK